MNDEDQKGFCLHCKDTFIIEPDITEADKLYCPYCRVVILGPPDDTWLPKLSPKEPKRGITPE